MTINEAIIQFKEDAEYNREYLEFDWAKENEQIAEWLEDYVKCKKAWSEVLQELEDIKEDVKESNFEYCIGELNGLNKVINIINRHLAD